MRRLGFLFAACLLPLCGQAHPALAQFAEGLKTLSGRFEQQVVDANGRPGERSVGQVSLAAPRQFRWDYAEPYPQTIIADGDRIWVYDPELEQVTVRPQAHEEQSNPLAALIDPALLAQQFEVSDEGVEGEIRWIKLLPRKSEDASFSEARLGLEGDQLKAMLLLDALQQRTEIRFFDWQRNLELPANQFRFLPPPGVDVVGDMGEDAQVFPLQ